MPILHCLPRNSIQECRLLAIYHDRLRELWRWPDRTLATGLAAIGIGSGWSTVERRLLPADTRATGLSMADRRGVHRMLNPAGYPPPGNLLRNKSLFARHVANHGLAAPETYRPGEQEMADWLSERSAVIAKPGFSSKGRGIVVFRREAARWRSAERNFGMPQLVKHLQSCLDGRGVIQDLLVAHPALAPLSPGALPTIRVMTCLDEAGDPEHCATILRLGSGGPRPVDNFNAGGLAVRVDDAGRCLEAFRAAGDGAETLTTHPVTGAPIAGQTIPDLDAAVALARRAHRSLPTGFRVVGWDIGLTDGGPMLIEGNWNPGTDIIQLVDGRGLDRTRLGELYRFHLGRLPDEQWRSARPIEW